MWTRAWFLADLLPPSETQQPRPSLRLWVTALEGPAPAVGQCPQPRPFPSVHQKTGAPTHTTGTPDLFAIRPRRGRSGKHGGENLLPSTPSQEASEAGLSPSEGGGNVTPPRVTQPQTASREQTPALPARHRPPATRLCLAPPGKRQPRDPPGVAGPPGLPLPTLEGLPWPGGGRPGPGRARLGGLRDDLAVTAATLHPLHWGPERPGPRRCPALDGRPT